jgi:hypothetical protein
MFCIFMTYSTSCCCHYKLMDPWSAYTCVYVCLLKATWLYLAAISCAPGTYIY